MNRRFTIRAAFVLPVLLAFGGCEAQKSSNPLSPSVAGPIPGTQITAPKLLEPAQSFKFRSSQQPIRLLIENASSTGVRPLSYTFELSADPAFGSKAFARSGVPPGEGGRTSAWRAIHNPIRRGANAHRLAFFGSWLTARGASLLLFLCGKTCG